ncbi:MAG TPA: chemotaxis protein CheW, partial [Phycisphaerae bacterium]
MTNESEHQREILRARARALARAPQVPAAAGDCLELVEFRLGPERYAVERRFVREVQPLKDLTPLPCTPAFVVGMVNVRGQILAVIDLKKIFDVPDTGMTDSHSIIILQVDDIELGILADTIDGVRCVPCSAIQTSLPTAAGIRAEYLRGITAERLVVLDAAKILTDQRIIVDE